MAKGESRLWRKLGAVDSIFSFSYGTTVLTDATIASAAIHRGGAGVSPATLEVVTGAFAGVATGEDCTLSLTPYGEALVNSLTGVTGSLRSTRFKGRLGQQRVDDRGKRQYTSFFGASLVAQLPAIQKLYSFPRSTYVRDVLRTIMNPPSLPAITVANAADVNTYGRVWEPIVDAKYSDLVGKFTTDLGILARVNRAGTVSLQTNAYRHATAIAALSEANPIARSQALAPAVWEQANDTRARNYLLKYTGGTLSSPTLVEDIYGEPGDTLAEVLELDMSYVQFRTGYEEQPGLEANAQRAREWLTGYAVPSVKVDLLQLLSSDRRYDQIQAAKLLGMEVGAPVYFSGDWHPNLRGIQYAEEITEIISPDAWELEFKLLPSREVTGITSPDIPARVWDQATYPWDTETRIWDEA